MKIGEAIKELEKVGNRDDIICYHELREAVKLGIEALNQIQRIRVIEGNPDICGLIGETEE